MKASDNAYKIIEHFEGKHYHTYRNTSGRLAIGSGTLIYPNGSKVKEDDVCTETQRLSYMRYRMELCESAIKRLVESELTQNQFDALVALVYHIGTVMFGNSVLLDKVNIDSNHLDIPICFQMWAKSEGHVLPTYLRRRKSEATLYTTGKLSFTD